MADDELSAPLGQSAPKKGRRRIAIPISAPNLFAVALASVVAVCAVWAVVVDDPLGGEPKAMVATRAAPAKVAMPAVTSPGAGPSRYEGPIPPLSQPAQPPAAAAAAAPPSGAKTVTIIDGSTGKRQEVPIAGVRDARAPVDERLLETTRHGAIPKVGPNGARPAEVYARPQSPVPNRRNNPQIAIVVTGLGVSATATDQAIARLPGPITLAFTPYGGQVEAAVASARADGHEVLLQMPMEPFDYPDNDPGPQTLLMSLSPDQNLDRLHWLMSRFRGYVGIVNFMGARFTSSEQALGPVMRETGKRGLIYFDDASSPRSLAGQIAGANSLPFAKADVSIDAVPTPAHIDRALTRLEALARDRGVVVAVATALPASIERIAQWAKAAESRGFVLVPISAVAIKPRSS
ncbi:MAG: divergent polysaccharide deacetylase family protein [Alphaproteobacteria bacterium]|nr:divergent polysaccharide deacetylase family protein [Alphaproteobacteria bacterium]